VPGQHDRSRTRANPRWRLSVQTHKVLGFGNRDVVEATDLSPDHAALLRNKRIPDATLNLTREALTYEWQAQN
jgi:hypothetical protein